MRLTGKQIKQLSDALLDGYPTESALKRMARIALEPERVNAFETGVGRNL